MISAIVVLSLMYFAEPLGDDICHAARGRNGVLADVVRNWQYNGSRWTAFLVEDWLTPRLGLSRFYPLPLAVFWLGQAAAVYVLIRALLGAASRHAFAPAIGFVLLFWSNMPSPGESLFWLNGSVEYQLGLTLTLFLLALLVRNACSPWRFVTAALLAILIPGVHELTGLLLCLVLACGTVHKHPARRRWAALSAVAFLSLGVTLLAPGDWARASRHPENRNLLHALTLTVLQLGSALPRWIFDVRLLAATVLFVTDPRIPAPQPSLRRLRWIVPLVWVVVLAAGFFVPAWGIGVAAPGRVQSWTYFVFLAGWFAAVYIFYPWPPALERRAFSPALALFAAAVIFQGNTWIGIDDLARRAVPWHNATEDRYRRMAGAADAGVRDVRVPPLPVTPRLYFDYNLGSDPAYHANHCLAEYFGVASVTCPK
jgi:hypothetical protein